MKLNDRTGQVWERIAGDELDATWIVLGPPQGDGHPCGTFDDGSVCNRVEVDQSGGSWESAPFLWRLV